MAGMRAVHKKNGTTFKYSGDLKETIEKAEKELKEKDGTTQCAQIFECEMEYKEIVTALTGENRRKEHGNRIQRHGRTEQEQ